MFSKLPKRNYRFFEIAVWAVALVLLFFMPFGSSGTLCLSKYLFGISCPGCGIGHAMHEAMHMRFAASLEHHLFGVPAVLILIYRIFYLTIKQKQYVYISSHDTGS